MTIGEKLKTASDGFPCEPFDCVITRVFQMRSGEGQYGPWTMQGAETACGASLTFMNMADQSALVGAALHVECAKNKKGQLGGAKFTVRNKDGKEYRSVSITKQAAITVNGVRMNTWATTPATQPQAAQGTTLTEARVIELIQAEIAKALGQAKDPAAPTASKAQVQPKPQQADAESEGDEFPF